MRIAIVETGRSERYVERFRFGLTSCNSYTAMRRQQGGTMSEAVSGMFGKYTMS